MTTLAHLKLGYYEEIHSSPRTSAFIVIRVFWLSVCCGDKLAQLLFRKCFCTNHQIERYPSVRTIPPEKGYQKTP